MLLKSRYYLYTSLSIALVAYCVQDAFNTHRQFFPAVVSLTNSKYFGIFLGNGLLASLMLCFTFVRWCFFGQLEQFERQKVNDAFVTHIIETLLALTYFKSAVSGSLSIQFALMSVCKIFHHMAAGRLEVLERSAGQSMRDFIRLCGFLVILFNVDIICCAFLTSHLMDRGISVHLLLLSEFSLMAITAAATTVKLVLHQYEVLMQEDVWEAKGTFRFYTEIVQSFLSCANCIIFTVVMCRYTSFPIHLARQLYVNVVQAVSTLRNFTKYQRLASNIDANFRDATNEELEEDRTCAICYDEMLNDTHVKRLPCGHMFHRHCLRRWFEKNTICPYCRRDMDADNNRNNGQQNNAAAPAADPVPPAAAAAPGPAAAAAPEGAPRQPDNHELAAFELYRMLVQQMPNAAPLAAAPGNAVPAAQAPAPAAPAAAAPVEPEAAPAPPADPKTSDDSAAASPAVAGPPAARSRLLQPKTAPSQPPQATPATPLSPAHTAELDAYRVYQERVTDAQRELDMSLQRARTLSWSVDEVQ